MKFLKWLGITILAIVVLYLIIPLFLSSTFHVERSINIERPVEIVFQSAVDMNMRAKWDPWIELEPEVEMNVTTTPEIIGSGYTWKGEIIGKGEIEIVEFIPNELIKSKIRFIEPQSMESDVIWTFESNESGTAITWAFEGSLSYPVEKWFGLFMDKSLGGSFEKGLSNFKKLVEKLPDNIGRTGQIQEITFIGVKAVSIKEKCAMNKLSGKMFEMYTGLMGFLKKNNVELEGSPFAIYHPTEEEGYTMLECALPVMKKITGEDNIKYIEIPEGKAVMASHFGHYNTVKTTYKEILNYISENNLEVNGSPWEVYITDPTKEFDQSKWETQVHFPIK
jgi:effector-binding domain-containing protein